MNYTPVPLLHTIFENRFGEIDFAEFRAALASLHPDAIWTVDINGTPVEVLHDSRDELRQFADQAHTDFYLSLHDRIRPND